MANVDLGPIDLLDAKALRLAIAHAIHGTGNIPPHLAALERVDKMLAVRIAQADRQRA